MLSTERVKVYENNCTTERPHNQATHSLTQIESSETRQLDGDLQSFSRHAFAVEVVFQVTS
jgi:hypothetical protein